MRFFYTLRLQKITSVNWACAIFWYNSIFGACWVLSVSQCTPSPSPRHLSTCFQSKNASALAPVYCVFTPQWRVAFFSREIYQKKRWKNDHIRKENSTAVQKKKTLNQTNWQLNSLASLTSHCTHLYIFRQGILPEQYHTTDQQQQKLHDVTDCCAFASQTQTNRAIFSWCGLI